VNQNDFVDEACFVGKLKGCFISDKREANPMVVVNIVTCVMLLLMKSDLLGIN
jgi:hypothetical protein